MVITVRIFASHPSVVAHCRPILARGAGIATVAGNEAFQVGVFDTRMDGLDAAFKVARAVSPDFRAILLCSSSDIQQFLYFSQPEICGAVEYERCEQELVSAAFTAAEGRVWCRADVFRPSIRPALAPLKLPDAGLTGRERQTLLHLIAELSNKEIADEMNIAESTVKAYLGSIYRKLGVSSRRELVALVRTGRC